MNNFVPARSVAGVRPIRPRGSVHPQISYTAAGDSAECCPLDEGSLTPDNARDCLLASISRGRAYDALPLEQCLGRVLARDVVSRLDLDPSTATELDCYASGARDLHQLFNADGTRSRERIRAGSMVLRAGRRLRPQDLGAASSAGHDALEVVRRPRVALLMIGDESPGCGAHPQSASTRVGYRSSLAAMLDALNCHVVCAMLSEAGEDRVVESLCAAAGTSDLVISTAASAGLEACVKRAVRKVGRLDQSRVRLRPGASVAFGRIGITPFIGLPGHPLSAIVTFLLFAAPAIRRLLGRSDLFPSPLMLPTAFEHCAEEHEDYLLVNVGRRHLHAAQPLGTGCLLSATRIDGLARVEPGRRVLIAECLEYFSYESLLG